MPKHAASPPRKRVNNHAIVHEVTQLETTLHQNKFDFHSTLEDFQQQQQHLN